MKRTPYLKTKIFNQFLDMIVLIHRFEVFALFSYDVSQQTYELISGQTFLHPLINRLQKGPHKEILTEACRVVVNTGGIGATLVVPFSCQGQHLGVFIAILTDPVTSQSKRMITLLGQQTSLCLYHLYQALQFKNLTERDELTGLNNYRELEKTLAEEMSRSSRYNQPFSLIFIDLDQFKAVNDEHGHEAGNSILKTIASILAQSIRQSDRLFRFGGDEFVILLPQTSKGEAQRVVDRIQKDLNNRYYFIGGKSIMVKGSFGVAAYPEDGDTRAEILAKSDQEMYLQKSDKKRQVV